MENQPLLPIPEKYTVHESAYELSVIWKWMNPAAYFLVFFTLAWNGFLVAFVSAVPGAFAVFAVFHIAVGAFLAYYTLCLFVNRTTILTDRTAIKVSIGPLPYAGSKTIERFDIRQLYVKEKISRGKNSTTLTYDVQVIDKNNRSTNLVTGLQTLDQALFVEKKLEKFLGIADEPVTGEHK